MQIKTPDLGVDSAEVAEILVQVGDTVAKNDNILLVESDKASVEIPSPVAGKITEILVHVGDSISQGSVLFNIENSENTAKTQSKSNSGIDNTNQSEKSEKFAEDLPAEKIKAVNAEIPASSQIYSLPDLGVDSAEVAEILVQVGDTVKKNQSILLVESDKASVEVPAPVDGVVEEILLQAGDIVSSGQAFIRLKPAEQAMQSQTAQQKIQPAVAKANNSPNEKSTPSAVVDSQTITQTTKKMTESTVNEKARNVYAGPAVRKLARELGVDIGLVKGTALNGRIVKDDLFAYVKNLVQDTLENKPVSATVAHAGLPPLPDMSNQEIWGEIDTQALTRLQKVSIPQLNYNTYLPQVTQFDLADITNTENLRNSLKGEFKTQGIGLTILAFIVKVVAYALIQHPKFNSHLSDDNSKLIIRKSVHMGIAVATDDGLIVPVIKDAQNKGIRQLAIEIAELAKKARDKKLSAKELQGASFTISSQGNLGGTAFTPLVNFPQVAILGISEASMMPRWDADKKGFEPRLMLPLSLSYDHRVINGADAAVFTRYIANLLADLRKVLL